MDFKKSSGTILLHPASYGLFTGILTCVYFFVFYTINKKLFFNPLVFWSSFLFLFISFGIVVILYRQKSIPFPFKIALRNFFLIFFLNSALYHFFYFVMMHYIDNQMIDVQYNLINEGLKTNKILLAEEQQTAWNISKEELEKNIKGGTIGFSFIQGLPAGFLVSLLAAYLLKKE
ncbi:MAG: DUF4199 domain-containing protein [Bacteroidota bacterium]